MRSDLWFFKPKAIQRLDDTLQSDSHCFRRTAEGETQAVDVAKRVTGNASYVSFFQKPPRNIIRRSNSTVGLQS